MSQPEAPEAACDKDLRVAMRARAVAAREALPASRHATLSRLLSARLAPLMARLAPRCLAFCWPIRQEPDLREFVADWLAADISRRAALPQVVEMGQALQFARWQPGMAMAEDRYGIPVPALIEPVVPDLVLVPLNAFDGAGFRIGYGGGFFDRTLAAHRPPLCAVGVGFELGRVSSTLPQPHDCAMDWVVTEADTFSC